MTRKGENPNIKFKVILGFTMALLVIVAASYVTITSFNKLMESVEELSVPDNRLTLINNLMTNISEAENFIRSFSLTNDQKYIENYEQYILQINKELDSLEMLNGDFLLHQSTLDSIQSLWQAKTEGFQQFVALKSAEKRNDFSKKAMKEITNQSIDSTEIATTTQRTETVQTTVVPLEDTLQTNIKRPADKSVFSEVANTISKIFSKRKKDDQTQTSESTLQMAKKMKETTVVIDTTYVKHVNTDSLLNKVLRVLEDLQQQELALRSRLTRQELELLQRDIRLMDNLRGIIKQLQEDELKNSLEKAGVARSIAKESIITIFSIGGLGFLTGLVFISLILKDITRSNYYKSQLLKAKRKAEKLAKIKEEFMANMSHEIRTPLNAIIGFTEQLYLSGNIGAKENYYLQAVKNSSEHLLTTVNDILDFSKIEAGQLKMEKIPFNLADVVEQVYHTFQLKAREKNLEFNYKLDENSDQTLIGDPFRVRQILFNLVANAIKFTEKGAVKIRITGEKISHGIQVQFIVEDSGIGIRKAQVEAVFQGFQQADGSVTRKYGGTGLGLTICKRLTELQGGTIEVKSEWGKGTVFLVNIPFAVSDKKLVSNQQITDEINTTPLKGKSILVIDDDEYNILLCHTILQRWGMDVALASNGKEGMEFLKTQKFDLIVSDIQMPEISGFEIAEFSKHAPESKNNSTPLVILSANVMPYVKEKFISSGFNHFIYKPFREADLYNGIIEALEIDVAQMKNLPVKSNLAIEAGEVFNLSELEKFAEGDSKALVSMVEGIVQTNSKNLEYLRLQKKEKDWVKIGELAHKMIPSVAHVGNHHLVSILRKMEANSQLEKKEREELLQEMLEKIGNLLEQLGIRLQQMKNEMQEKKQPVS